MERDHIELDLQTIWHLIRKNIAMITVLTVVFAIGAFFVSRFLITPQFEAAVTIAVNTRDEAATIIASDQINAARQLVNTYAVVLTNDTLIDDIIRQLRLTDTISSLKSRISAEAVNQTQVMRITMRDRNPNTAKDVLDIIMSRAEELLITTVKAGSVEVVSPPRINYDPVSPRVNLNTAIGAGLGLFLAIAIVFLRKALRNNFISEEDVVNQLGLPVIGVIPSLDTQERRYG
ncbi:MAG: Wzz/FepE/Etk N-terminal domain-containing protein [Oscillospiraceae bacterium]|nr:Wzz/FepE/Etk N-terminal domain-containing protein [Oscillospiraceae bacterium]